MADLGRISETQENFSLQEGETVSKYRIEGLLGCGSYGKVYKVSDAANTFYALKTELRNTKVKGLKMEVVVLRDVRNLESDRFCELITCGRTKKFNYLVMSLVGKTIDDLRVNNTKSNRKLTLGCGISVGMQCLEAVHSLHNALYINRDIKPANFCLSLQDHRRILMIDFGMCRKFVDSDGNLRQPRWSVGFRGTLRYAALSTHYGKENCRKDDIESWLYVLIESLVGRLPWSDSDGLTFVSFQKQTARTSGLRELFSGVPKELIHALFYIDSLQFYDEPDYSILRGLLREALTQNNLEEHPYDWELNK
ncbi:unnamed protein product [Caenorhabditis auriculariae]|uniref:Protein kinase domain-containing protein n=1 Tax=Caenorhabditis auriculariae TaxID=2777116 RepID=A0A8S1HDZ8_9PELO|nr:unnamed protein product [Caenorhabditis auriculariae]